MIDASVAIRRPAAVVPDGRGRHNEQFLYRLYNTRGTSRRSGIPLVAMDSGEGQGIFKINALRESECSLPGRPVCNALRLPGDNDEPSRQVG
jgi:hypothetical protein